jgi:TRAP-type uncharacterized transport system substrate-binding protein
MHVLRATWTRLLLSAVAIGVAAVLISLPPSCLFSVQEARASSASELAKRLPTGAVVYPTPKLRGDHFYTWHGRWRDRIKVKAAAMANANQPVPIPPQRGTNAVEPSDALRLFAGDPTVAADLISVLDSTATHVVATTGLALSPTELLAKPYDLAIIPADALATDWPQSGSQVTNRLSYIARLFTTEIHVVAPIAITDVHQLTGRPVAVEASGSATARRVFDLLRITPTLSAGNLTDTLDRLQQGTSEAAIVVGGRSIPELAALESSGRFHLLAIPYEPSLQELYYPTRLTTHDYPHLIDTEGGVDTVSVGTLLIAVDATPKSPHYQKISDAAVALFEHFDSLLQAPRHPKWHEVNLAARQAQWQRFKPAEEWLARNSTAAISGESVTDPRDFKASLQDSQDDQKTKNQVDQTNANAPVSQSDSNANDLIADKEKLFSEFLTTWQRTRVK